jgi:hypothetical protein
MSLSGAWPFLVGGVICLVNSDNERDLNLLKELSASDGKLRAIEQLCYGVVFRDCLYIQQLNPCPLPESSLVRHHRRDWVT